MKEKIIEEIMTETSQIRWKICIDRFIDSTTSTIYKQYKFGEMDAWAHYIQIGQKKKDKDLVMKITREGYQSKMAE